MNGQGSENRDQFSVAETGLAIVPRLNATAIEGRICPGCLELSLDGGYCSRCREEVEALERDRNTGTDGGGLIYFLGVCAVMGWFVWELRGWWMQWPEVIREFWRGY